METLSFIASFVGGFMAGTGIAVVLLMALAVHLAKEH